MEHHEALRLQRPRRPGDLAPSAQIGFGSRVAFALCHPAPEPAAEPAAVATKDSHGGPRWTRTTYLRVISTALCQLS
jgi:hypothetical protein